MTAQTLATAEPSSSRDVRLDFFRGLALIFIFIDHVPGNSLSHLTLQAFGFSDAAEVFVLIAGYSAYTAYSRGLDRDGLVAGSRRVLLRVRDIFAAHLLLIAVCAGGLAICARYFENPLYFEHVNLTPFSYDPLSATWRAVALLYQPSYLNILPLYIVLLAWFPVLWRLLKWNPTVALGLSASFWLAARLKLINLPSWPDEIGWFFNPFAWQFLFTIGAFAAVKSKSGASLPRSPWLIGASAAYVLFAAIISAPWVNLPEMHLPRLVPVEMIPTISKSSLSTWRLGHILALAYLVALAVPATASWLRTRVASYVVSCGRNSLDIFCLGTILSFMGFAVMLEAGRSWPYQMAVNGLGVGTMFCVALWLTKRKARQAQAVKARAIAPAAEASPS